MSNLARFLKKNKKTAENGFYPATKSLTDENGEPLKWEFRAIKTEEFFEIRESCTSVKTAANGQMIETFDKIAFAEELLAAAVVFPDLHDAQLLDSYGCDEPRELLKEMIDNPYEYTAFLEYVQSYSGIKSLPDLVGEAKN